MWFHIMDLKFGYLSSSTWFRAETWYTKKHPTITCHIFFDYDYVSTDNHVRQLAIMKSFSRKILIYPSLLEKKMHLLSLQAHTTCTWINLWAIFLRLFQWSLKAIYVHQERSTTDAKTRCYLIGFSSTRKVSNSPLTIWSWRSGRHYFFSTLFCV